MDGEENRVGSSQVRTRIFYKNPGLLLRLSTCSKLRATGERPVTPHAPIKWAIYCWR